MKLMVFFFGKHKAKKQITNIMPEPLLSRGVQGALAAPAPVCIGMWQWRVM
jgi:hypothetical protein